MITRVEKIRLGIFLVTSSIVVIAVFITLAGIKLMEDYDTYEVHFNETVSGLEIGAQVKYNGVRVGQVSTININPKKLDQVKVELELTKGTPVKADLKAVLVGMGITGLKFVELTGGTDSAKLLPPGSKIKAGHSFMGTMEGKAEDIAVKVELVATKINSVLSEKNMANIDGILQNVNELSGNANNVIIENQEDLKVTIANLKKITTSIKKIMASLDRSSLEVEGIITRSSPKFDKIFTDATEITTAFKKTAYDVAQIDNVLRKMKNALDKFNNQLEKVDVGKMADDLDATIVEAKATASSLRRIVDSSRENIYTSSRSLKSMLKNFDDLARKLSEQPSLLLSSKPPKKRTPKE